MLDQDDVRLGSYCQPRSFCFAAMTYLNFQLCYCIINKVLVLQSLQERRIPAKGLSLFGASARVYFDVCEKCGLLISICSLMEKVQMKNSHKNGREYNVLY